MIASSAVSLCLLALASVFFGGFSFGPRAVIFASPIG